MILTIPKAVAELLLSTDRRRELLRWLLDDDVMIGDLGQVLDDQGQVVAYQVGDWRPGTARWDAVQLFVDELAALPSATAGARLTAAVTALRSQATTDGDGDSGDWARRRAVRWLANRYEAQLAARRAARDAGGAAV